MTYTLNLIGEFYQGCQHQRWGLWGLRTDTCLIQLVVQPISYTASLCLVVSVSLIFSFISEKRTPGPPPSIYHGMQSLLSTSCHHLIIYAIWLPVWLLPLLLLLHPPFSSTFWLGWHGRNAPGCWTILFGGFFSRLVSVYMLIEHLWSYQSPIDVCCGSTSIPVVTRVLGWWGTVWV